jgi:hypothetical protein
MRQLLTSISSRSGKVWHSIQLPRDRMAFGLFRKRVPEPVAPAAEPVHPLRERSRQGNPGTSGPGAPRNPGAYRCADRPQRCRAVGCPATSRSRSTCRSGSMAGTGADSELPTSFERRPTLSKRRGVVRVTAHWNDNHHFNWPKSDVAALHDCVMSVILTYRSCKSALTERIRIAKNLTPLRI